VSTPGRVIRNVRRHAIDAHTPCDHRWIDRDPPSFNRAKVIALWSDFKAFEAAVAERPDGKAVLALGGESKSETFTDLLRKLWELRGCTAVPYLGILVSALSGAALVLDLIRVRGVEPGASPNGGPATRSTKSEGTEGPPSVS